MSIVGADMVKLGRLPVGARFQVPGDSRVWVVMRHTLGSTLVRPDVGSGKQQQITDHITGETKEFESRKTTTFSTSSIVILRDEK